MGEKERQRDRQNERERSNANIIEPTSRMEKGEVQRKDYETYSVMSQ